MARPFDSDDKHPLMPGAGPCDALRDDASLLRDKPLKLLLGFVVDEVFLVVAEAACALFPDLACCASL